AEAGRRRGEAPWRVQLAVRGDAAEEGPARAEPVDEAVALAGHVVVGRGVLFRVRDEDRAAEVLDPKGRVAGGDVRVGERARRAHLMEAPVEDVDAAVVEVGRVEEVAARSRGDR